PTSVSLSLTRVVLVTLVGVSSFVSSRRRLQKQLVGSSPSVARRLVVSGPRRRRVTVDRGRLVNPCIIASPVLSFP
ncbi:hypothetical protein S245_049690, partial [Arachis hypogaea]